MAFGKIRVLREFGAVEEYELDKPTTSVGRQPGNDIVLPTTAVSRYHAQFDVAEGRVYLVDLGAVNGTFVNDEQVKPNARVPLESGDEIVMGEVKLIYLPPESREYFSLVPTVEPVAKEGVPFKLLLDEPHQDVAPGARLNLQMLIENTGFEEATYAIEVSGMEEEWIRANWRELTLNPGQQGEVQVSVRPPRSSTTLPGRYPLTVRVALKDDPLQFLEAVRGIDVVGYNGFAMGIRPGDHNGEYKIVVQNQGNSPTSIQFGGFSRDGQLDYKFTPPQVRLDPGEVQRAELHVKPKGRPSSGREQIDFAVIARSLDAAAYQAPIPAQYTLTASGLSQVARIGLPLLLGAAIALMALVVAALVLFGLGPFRPDPTPIPVTATAPLEAQSEEAAIPPPADAAVRSFTAEPREVVFRVVETVTLTWEVEDAEQLTLFDERGNPVLLSDEDIANGSYELAAQNLPVGEHTFGLRVVGSDGVPINEETPINVRWQICELEDGNAMFEEPSAEASLLDPVSGAVRIIGQNGTGDWIYVQDHVEGEQRGWVTEENVICRGESAVDLGRFFVVETAATPDTETPTPGVEDG